MVATSVGAKADIAGGPSRIKMRELNVSKSGPLYSTMRTLTMRADTSQKGQKATLGWASRQNQLALSSDPSYKHAQLDSGAWCKSGQSGLSVGYRRYWLPMWLATHGSCKMTKRLRMPI